MKRKYYAAVLVGFPTTVPKQDYPRAIEKVYAFDGYSDRNHWLEMSSTSYPEGVRVKVCSKIAKKHEPIVTERREAERFGKIISVWVYNGTPDWLT